MKKIKISQSFTDRQDASLKLYFRDVSKQPMIDVDEEIKLAKRIKRGDKKAFNKLVNANLRFVISVAKQYQHKGIPLVDLIQAGNCGLIESISHWDYTRGFKFISYAVWWIRQAILQAISSECRTVRVPMNQVANMNKINKVTEKLEQELKRSPSVEEISLDTELDADKINLTLSSISKAVSLDTSFKNDEDCGSLLDIIPNTDSEKIGNNITQEAISKEVEKVLAKLPNRESDVLKMFFGIGMLPMTLEEISGRFGVTSERIRQIHKEAIERIRKRYIKDLKNLL